VTSTAISAAPPHPPQVYWEERAQRFGVEGEGLRVQAITGVDPAPFKTRLWPHLPQLAAPVRTAALALGTALSVPIDVLLGRSAVKRSWHAVFILEHERDGL
jgi:hypothetical protein